MVDLAAAVSYLDVVGMQKLSIEQIEGSQDLDEEIDKILQMQQERHPHSVLHAIAFY